MENVSTTTTTEEENLEAKDFCFYLEEDEQDGDAYAYFCPLSHFRESGRMSKALYDVLDRIVPDHMDEMQDNCYATSASLEEVREELLSLGFVQDEEFDSFMSNIGEAQEELEVPALTGT